MIKKVIHRGTPRSLCMLSTSTWALGIHIHHERSKGQKCHRRAHLTEEGTVSPSILFGKNKKQKRNKFKKLIRRDTSSCSILGVQGSELAGTAGVTLQETHNGWVAFGPSDEFFQGEFS